jgi:hypothetical protein
MMMNLALPSLIILSLISLLLYIYIYMFMRCASRCMCWDENSGSWHVWGKTGRRRHFGYFDGGELETTDLGSGMRVHSSVHSHLYGFRSTCVGVLHMDGGHELSPV